MTNLGDRSRVLCVSIAYVGIPVAWRALAGNREGPWHPHGCDLLGRRRPAVPRGRAVIVLTDRPRNHRGRSRRSCRRVDTR